MKKRKILYISILILIFLSILLIFIIKANANTNILTQETTMTRMVAALSRAKDTNNEQNATIMQQELNKYLGNGKATAQESSGIQTITYGNSNNSYTINDNLEYTITYNLNGGTGTLASQTKKFGNRVKIHNSIIEREGYTFLGWSTNSSAITAEYQPGTSYLANENATLYAVWTAKPTIKYNANGGENAPEMQIKEFGVAITLSNSKPVRTGYTFLGWATNSSATTAEYQPGDTYTQDVNLDLYAVWKANELVLLNGTENQDAWTLETGSKTSEGLEVYHSADAGLNKAWKCSTTWTAGEYETMVVNAFYNYGAAQSNLKVRFYNASNTLIQTTELWSNTEGVSDVQDQDFERAVTVPDTAVKCDFVFYCGPYFSGSGYKLYKVNLYPTWEARTPVLLDGTENQDAWTLEAGSKTSEGLEVYHAADTGINKAWKCRITWTAGEYETMVVNAFYNYGAAQSNLKVRFYNASNTLIQTTELWSNTEGVSDVQDQNFERVVTVPDTAVKCDFVFYCGPYFSGSGYKLYKVELDNLE